MFQIPDRPISFGFKNAWLACSTVDSQEVAEALGISEIQPSTWVDGINQAYEKSVFVTPPLQKWTLAVGFQLAPPNDPKPYVKSLLELLSERFGDAQYFCTHRVVGLHVWARAIQGSLIRGYAYLGESGETLWNEQSQTIEETELGFNFFDERQDDAEHSQYWSKTGVTHPDEEHVMQLAGKWGIDPSSLEEQFSEPSLGIVGKLTRSNSPGQISSTNVSVAKKPWWRFW